MNYKPSQRTVYSDFNKVVTTGINGVSNGKVDYKFDGNQLTISGKGKKSFAVYDLQGRLVMNGRANGDANVNLSSLHGTYVLQMTTETGKKSIQFVR